MCDGQWTTAAATDNLQYYFFITFKVKQHSCLRAALARKTMLWFKVNKMLDDGIHDRRRNTRSHVFPHILPCCYLSHSPNSSRRYCLIVVKMLSKQFNFNVLFWITSSFTALPIAKEKMVSKTKLCFHMLAHCPSHLTVANSPDQEQQLVFSCTFAETKETFCTQ